MNLKEWKAHFIGKTDWRSQRGPNDTEGYQRDIGTIQAVKNARTWNALLEVVPWRYSGAAANRCRLSDL